MTRTITALAGTWMVMALIAGSTSFAQTAVVVVSDSKIESHTETVYVDVVGDGGWANTGYGIRQDGGVDCFNKQKGVVKRLGEKQYNGISAVGNGDARSLWAVHDNGIDRLHWKGPTELHTGRAYTDIAGDFYRRHAVATRKAGGVDVVIYNGDIVAENLLPDMKIKKITRHGSKPSRFWALTDDGVYHLTANKQWNDIQARKVLDGDFVDLAAQPLGTWEFFVVKPDGTVSRVTDKGGPAKAQIKPLPWLKNVKAIGDFGGWKGTGSRWGHRFYAVMNAD